MSQLQMSNMTVECDITGYLSIIVESVINSFHAILFIGLYDNYYCLSSASLLWFCCFLLLLTVAMVFYQTNSQ